MATSVAQYSQHGLTGDCRKEHQVLHTLYFRVGGGQQTSFPIYFPIYARGVVPVSCWEQYAALLLGEM